MKRILFLLTVIGISYQVKAQQLTFKPADSLLFKTPKNLNLQKFKLDDSTLFKSLAPLTKANQLAALTKIDGNTEIFYGRMPVAKVGSIGKMPVVSAADPNMHYPMLIKKVKVIDPLATIKPITP